MSERTVNIIRWVMLLPISIMISVFVHEIALTLSPFLPYSKGIFWIDQSLYYSECFLSGFVFVYSGALIAPHYKKHTAIILAIIQPIMVTLAFAFIFTRFDGDQPIFWSVYQGVLLILLVTVIGGIVAAFLVYKFEKKKYNTQVEEQCAGWKIQVMKTKLLKIFITIPVIFVVVSFLWNVIFYTLIHPPIGQSYESSAIGNVRTVVGAQSAFKNDENGFASTWEELRRPYSYDDRKFDHYLEVDLSGIARRYKYTLKPAGDSLTGKNGTTVYTDFECFAEPVEYEEDTNRSFYVDSTGVVRYEFGKDATKDSDPL